MFLRRMIAIISWQYFIRRTKMTEDLKQVRDALESAKTFLGQTVYVRGYGGPQYSEVCVALATLDRIIADHIPDARKMVVPDGYALVPIEPTKEMIWSGIENTEEFVNGDHWYGSEPLSDGQAEQCYKAMLSTAPQPPTKGD